MKDTCPEGHGAKEGHRGAEKDRGEHRCCRLPILPRSGLGQAPIPPLQEPRSLNPPGPPRTPKLRIHRGQVQRLGRRIQVPGRARRLNHTKTGGQLGMHNRQRTRRPRASSPPRKRRSSRPPPRSHGKNSEGRGNPMHSQKRPPLRAQNNLPRLTNTPVKPQHSQETRLQPLDIALHRPTRNNAAQDTVLLKALHTLMEYLQTTPKDAGC